MAERYLFFNSTQNDRRRYQASDMADYWESFLSSGLIHENGQPQLAVNANGMNRNVTIPIGRALVRGHLYINDADLHKRIGDPDSLLDRIDRVILRYDNSLDSRSIKSFVLEGETSANPLPPALTREGDIYEISLAQIRVVAGKSFIEQSDILDERLDESVCGLASSLVTVPTDIFTAEWKEFVAEYNRWFAELQGSSYATVDDVRASENNMKREIANLNLQLEANKRVKNGVTFGTNFADAFGMEIDMARTLYDEGLTVGQTVITVRDASEFKAGTEVTIFDDVNLERINIASISGNVITLETALSKVYKEGVNIARSMSLQNSLNKTLSFGVWGTYNYGELRVVSPVSSGGTSQQYTGGLLRIGSVWIKGERNKVLILSKENAWGVLKDYSTSSRIRVAKMGNYLLVVRKESDNNIHVDKIDVNTGTVLSTKVIKNTSSDLISVNTDENLSTLYVLTNGAINRYSYTSYDFLSDAGEVTLVFGAVYIQLSEGLLDYVYDDSGNMYFTVSYKTSSSSTNSNAYLFKVNFSVTTKERVTVRSSNVSNAKSFSLLYKNINNQIRLIFGHYQGLEFYNVDQSAVLGSAISTWKANLSMTNGQGVTANASDVIYYANDNAIFMVLAGASVGESVLTFTSAEKDTIGTNDVSVFNQDISFEGEIPFFSSSSTTNTMLVGKGALGYGAELTTNDIRFKTKPSKELVTWLQHDGRLTVDEVKTGNVYAELSTVGNETQAVGVSTQLFDEVRVTISRQTIDEDVKITRILGGVD